VQERGMSEPEARKRMAAQSPQAEKIKRATHIIDNSGALNDLDRQLEALWERLRAEDNRKHERYEL